MTPLLAGVELGGTKVIVLVARGAEIVAEHRFATGDDAGALLATVADRLAEMRDDLPFEAIGLASFGPLAGNEHGFSGIGATPKPGWSETALVPFFSERFEVPVLLDTDVAGAALAEWRFGANAGVPSLAYLTIGTGIGGAVLVDGRIARGFTHSEFGHMRVRRDPQDRFAGSCPFHGDCLEGLASGPAIAARAGQPAVDLPREHPLWAQVADELAELCAILLLTLAPHRILLGGGVALGAAFPLEAIRAAVLAKLGGYVPGVDRDSIADRIGCASLGARAGPLGAIAVAADALRR